MLELLLTLFGVGIAGSLITLLVSLVKGIMDSGLVNPTIFPTVLAGTFSNLSLWGGALGGVITALIGVLFVFVICRIVVTLL